MSKNRIQGLYQDERDESQRESPLVRPGGLVADWECEEDLLEDDAQPQSGIASINMADLFSHMSVPIAISGAIFQPDTTQQTIVELTERVQYLESLVPAWQSYATYFEVRDTLNQIVELTAGIFGGNVNVREQQDCETPAERYFILEVTCGLSIDDILKKQDEWHSHVAALPANVRGLFRLMVDPQ
jgi:hypothetical protein